MHRLLLKPLLLLSVAWSLESQAICLFWCNNEQPDPNPDKVLGLNSNSTINNETQVRTTLSELQTQMVAEFSKVETSLATGNSAEALKNAKIILDTVKVKTGIDPKVKIKEFFRVNTKFPDGAKKMSDLSEDQKYQVIRAVADYGGGLYMDLMNLAKRTTLLHVRALKAEMLKRGGLTEQDRQKLVQDLVVAALVPILVVDEKGHNIKVFDSDVANEDHTYMFNRELKMFLLTDSDLKVSEKDFDERLTQRRGLEISDKDSQLSNQSSKQTEGILEMTEKCYGLASKFIDYRLIETYKQRCFDKYFNSFLLVADCLSFASKSNDSRTVDSAKERCINRFHPM